MKIKKIVILVFLLFLTSTAVIIGAPIRGLTTETYQLEAKTADSFIESMGIGTKFGFCPGRLCDRYSQVKNLLAELGIRYIRDIPYPESWRIRTDLYTDLGIQMLAETGRIWGKPLQAVDIKAQLAAIESLGKMVVGIVGVNEYDNPVYHSCEETEGCDSNWSTENWATDYLQYQYELYQQVKADPKLQQLPVVMGPMAHLDNTERLTEMSDFCDRGNDHSYPGAWGLPSQESGGGTKNSVRSLDKVVAKVQQICPAKPLWITETGYEEATEGQPNQYVVSQQAKAKYLPRIYANYYLQPEIEKTFLFELLNATESGTKFGIIDTNLQPTPAYYALKNLISLLGEATWNPENQSWDYPVFQPDFLKYSLTGNTKNLQHLLLQKSDRTFYLLLWQEVYVYDVRQSQDIINPELPIQLTFKNATIEKANQYLLYNSENPAQKLTASKLWQDVSSLSLAVPDHILVVEFSLKK